jgi:hypothetical protein
MINDLRINVTSVNPLKDEDLLKLLPDNYLLVNGNDSLSKKELEEIAALDAKVPRKKHDGYTFNSTEIDLAMDLYKQIEKIKEPFNKRQIEFQRSYLKKACGVTRGIVAAIAEYFPRAGVIISYNYAECHDIQKLQDGNKVADVAPFVVTIAHYGPSKDNKKDKITVEELVEEERE